MIKTILSIVFVLSFLGAFSQGHNIEIKIENLKNKEIILGHHFNDQLIPDDTITLSKNGVGFFRGKDSYPGGMYFLFLPSKQLFDFILDDKQDFTLIADTFNFSETVSFKNSKENTLFVEYQKRMRESNLKQQELSKKYGESKGDNKKLKEIEEESRVLRDEMNAYHNKVVSDNADMFFSKFLTATRRPEVPKEITDKKQQYFWFRNHYYDNFDVSDPRLLRTPIYQNTIETYIDKVIMQHPDTLIAEVDMLMEKSRTNKELFRFMLVYLFNKYASSQIMTSENVFVYIADTYYIKEADWSDRDYIAGLKKRLVNTRKCLIGNQAYNINYSMAPLDTINIIPLIKSNTENKTKGLQIENSEADSIVKYNLKVELLQDYFRKFEETAALKDNTADYTILWFWTPSCSHCKKDTPKFYEMYLEKEMKSKNVEIISFYMQKDITDWKKYSKDLNDWLVFIKKHNMNEWINAWNPFDSFRRNYNIESSPVLFLLDKDKKIIAKKIKYEQAFEIIESELKAK